jgi:hypothetical protein
LSNAPDREEVGDMRIAARWILGGLALAGRAVLLRPGTRANRVVKGTRMSIAPLDQAFECFS